MKSFGKIALIALAAATALALAACGGNAASSAASKSASSSSSTSSTSTSAKSTSTSSTSTSTSSTSTSTSSAYAGIAAANTYTNDYFGIAYNKQGDWVFSDSKSIMTGSDRTAAYADGKEIDMVATNADGSAYVYVLIEKASEQTKGQDAATHLQALVDGSFGTVKNNANANYKEEDATVTFDGSSLTMPAKICTATVNGQTISVGVACYEKDGNFMDILVTGKDEQAINQAINNFVTAVK